MNALFPVPEFTPLPQAMAWVVTALTTDLADAPLVLDDAKYSLEVRDERGRLMLHATTANKKFFTAAGGVVGWTFSPDEMAALPAGIYEATLEATRGSEIEPIDIGPLAFLKIEGRN